MEPNIVYLQANDQTFLTVVKAITLGTASVFWQVRPNIGFLYEPGSTRIKPFTPAVLSQLSGTCYYVYGISGLACAVNQNSSIYNFVWKGTNNEDDAADVALKAARSGQAALTGSTIMVSGVPTAI